MLTPHAMRWNPTAVRISPNYASDKTIFVSSQAFTPNDIAGILTTTIIADSTAPIVTPQITGVLGTNGWYTNNVTVSWNVSDPESGIVSSQGCGSTVFNSDTPGTTLTCSAVNGAGLTASATASVKIDKTAPAISGMPGACSLWPPNGKFVQVADITASDALSGIAAGSLAISVTSNEASDPKSPDFVIAPDGSGGFTVSLRAQRLGSGDGRVYTMSATAADLAGNHATSQGVCTVPHNQ